MLDIIRRILRLSGKTKSKLLLSFAVGFLESVMPSLSLLFMFFSFRWYLAGDIRMKRIIWVALFLLCSLVLRFIFKLLEYRLQSGAGYEMVCNQRLALGEKLLHLPMSFYHDTDAGELSSVVNDDLVFVEGMAMSFLSKIISAMISIVLLMLTLLILDFRIALLALLAYPFAILVHHQTQQIYQRKSKERQTAHAATSSVMLEYLHGIYVVKAFRITGIQKKRLEGVLKNLEMTSYDFEMDGMPYMTLYFVIFNLFTAVILFAVAFFFSDGSLPLEKTLLLVITAFSVYAPMETLGMTSGILRLMNECIHRMETVLETPDMDKQGGSITPAAFDIRFRNVSFSYGEKQVLTGIDFYAPEKTLTAIVGPSGSGKSTLLSLIARFHDAKSGTVEIGGVDVRRMRSDVVLRNISFIFQKVYLFHNTIEANLRFGNPNAAFADIREAAKKAHCHEFIEKMANGYQTVIGEGGVTLSGGERQRIAIARALLKDAPIILLDEATVNIDPENELLIQEAIDALIREKTVFVVAHKLSPIKNAQQIIVLNQDGRVQETGTHEALIREGGAYRRLWDLQARTNAWNI